MSCNADADETLFGNDKSESPSNEFTVTFDTNGGSTITSQTVQAGEKATKPKENPTKDGHIFDKWYSDEALTTVYDFDTPVTKDITVYAKWTPDPFGFKAKETNSKVALTKVGTPTDIYFEYSMDASNWSDYSVATEIILTAVGDKVYFRAKDVSSSGEFNKSYNYENQNGDYYYFTISSGKVDVFGNIMNLVDVEGQSNVSSYIFAGLFTNCTNLKSAENLILRATNLAENCYNSMFYGCTNLKTAPELPALTMAVHCYNRMFYDCSNLETAPALNSTALASWCYKYMFYGCISSTETPELPATALADYCYEGMFQGCTSLTTAAELPATTLSAGFCYSYMFFGCRNLSSVTVRLTSWNSNASENWLQDVAATGTFTCPPGLDKTRGESRIPNGWTISSIT